MQIIGHICTFDGGVPVFIALVWGEPLKSGPQNLALKILETLLCLYDFDIFADDYFILSQCTCWQTDRQKGDSSSAS